MSDKAQQAAFGTKADLLDATATTRATILNKAMDCVTRDRTATHGEPEDLFGEIAAIWSVRLGVTVTASQVCILMDDLKSCRAWSNPTHMDNWTDKAGYAACGGELAGVKS